MITKQAKEAIYTAYNTLKNNIPMDGWTNHIEKLFAMCKKEEKEHRAFGRNLGHTRFGMSVDYAAMMFTIKAIVSEFQREGITPDMVLHYRPSCVYGTAIALHYCNELSNLFSDDEIDYLLGLDYAEIVKA